MDPLDQIDGILSGVKYNKTTGKVIKASALLNIWLLKQNGTKDPNGELIDPIAMEWEKTFIEEIIVKKIMDVPKELIVNGFTDRRYAKNKVTYSRVPNNRRGTFIYLSANFHPPPSYFIPYVY